MHHVSARGSWVRGLLTRIVDSTGSYTSSNWLYDRPWNLSRPGAPYSYTFGRLGSFWESLTAERTEFSCFRLDRPGHRHFSETHTFPVHSTGCVYDQKSRRSTTTSFAIATVLVRTLFESWVRPTIKLGVFRVAPRASWGP
jgi:hypothetical protein